MSAGPATPCEAISSNRGAKPCCFSKSHLADAACSPRLPQWPSEYRLAPVAHSIAAFFKKFSSMEDATRKEASSALLDPILRNSKYASEYYAIWVLSIFADNPVWDHAETLLRILRETRSDAVRRFAALALGTSGSRAHVIHVKQYLASASSLCRTGLMLATAKMGKDERKYLRQSLRLHDSFEKLCIAA